MKKVVLIVALVIAIGTQSFAQTKAPKFGYINSLELLSLMPEIKPADQKLEAFATELETLYKQMLTEYQNKVVDFQNKEAQMTDAVKEVKIGEIQDLERRIQEFQYNTEEKLNRKKEELYAPILDKANDAIQAVAKTNGYTYIFDSSLGTLLYAEESDNILDLVKTKLGI